MILFVLRRLALELKTICRQLFITLELFPFEVPQHSWQSAFQTFDIACELKCKTCAAHNFISSETQWLDKYYTRSLRKYLNIHLNLGCQTTGDYMDQFFGMQTPKQCKVKQRVLRSFYLIYSRNMCIRETEYTSFRYC